MLIDEERNCNGKGGVAELLRPSAGYMQARQAAVKAAIDPTAPEALMRLASNQQRDLAPIYEQLRSVTTPQILEILESRFVKCADVAEILALGCRTGKNVLLWGPGGHGKSEMVRDALVGLGLKEQVFVLDFGEGTTEADIWGGLNFERLAKEHVLDYNPERSWLNKPVAVFEELLDASPQVVAALKNTLTQGELCKSETRFPKKTHIIVACTNKNPEEFAKLNPSLQALIDRFPLQLNVTWDDYSGPSYTQMFDRLGLGEPAFNRWFGDLIAKAGSNGDPISPRTAVWGHQILTAKRKERGAATVGPEDVRALRFVGLGVLAGAAEAEAAALALEQARQYLEERRQQMTQIAESVKENGNPLEAIGELLALEDELTAVTPAAELLGKHTELLRELQKTIEAVSKQAVGS